MKKMGIMVVFLVFLTTGFIFAQEDEPEINPWATCQVVVMDYSNIDGELEVEFNGIVPIERSNGATINRLSINMRNRSRNLDVQIERVKVKGITRGGREVEETFRGSKIKYSKEFVDHILPHGSKKGRIRVRLEYINTVTEVTIYADVCQL